MRRYITVITKQGPIKLPMSQSLRSQGQDQQIRASNKMTPKKRWKTSLIRSTACRR